MRAFWRDRMHQINRQGFQESDADRAVETLVEFMDERQQQYAPVDLLASQPVLTDLLVSTGIVTRSVTRSGTRLRFGHQSFFDYRVARRTLDRLRRSKTQIVDWVRADQSLFRREQLRQVLELLRQDSPLEYGSSIEVLLLDDSIRFHLKHLVFRFLGEQDPPLDSESEVASRIVAQKEWRTHALELGRYGAGAWFDALDDSETISALLDSDDDESINIALGLCRAASISRGQRVATILSELQERGEDWKSRVDSLLAFTE